MQQPSFFTGGAGPRPGEWRLPPKIVQATWARLREAQVVLSFLQFLLESALGESTLRGYVAATSECHKLIDGFTVISQALVSLFPKGAIGGCAPHIPVWFLHGIYALS